MHKGTSATRPRRRSCTRSRMFGPLSLPACRPPQSAASWLLRRAGMAAAPAERAERRPWWPAFHASGARPRPSEHQRGSPPSPDLADLDDLVVRSGATSARIDRLRIRFHRGASSTAAHLIGFGKGSVRHFRLAAPERYAGAHRGRVQAVERQQHPALLQRRSAARNVKIMFLVISVSNSGDAGSTA